MAAHAIKAGEGDVFVAGGVETVSRFENGAADSGAPEREVRATRAPARRSAPRAASRTWTPPAGLPDVYIAMGQTAENVVEAEGVTREEMDEFAARSQQRAVASQENGFFEREITPVTSPTARSSTKDDGPRAGTTVEKLATLKPVFRPDGTVTAGQRVPAERRRGRGVVMSDTKAQRARHHAARADRRQRRERARTRRSWASARSRRAGRRSSAPA